MRGRLYDPLIAKFMSPDPIISDAHLSEGLNPYSYVFNSPMNWVDPSGFEADLGGSSDAASYSYPTGCPECGGGATSASGFDPLGSPDAYGNPTTSPDTVGMDAFPSGDFAGTPTMPAGMGTWSPGSGQTGDVVPSENTSGAFGAPPEVGPEGQPAKYYKGTKIHEAIAGYYAQVHSGEDVVTNTINVRRILSAVSGSRPDLLTLVDLGLRPDIVNLDTGDVYEIKPEVYASSGMQSLMLYLGLLQRAGMTSAHPGIDAPGTSGMMQIGGVTVQFGLATNGLILYRIVPTPVPAGSPVVGRVLLAGGLIATVYASRYMGPLVWGWLFLVN